MLPERPVSRGRPLPADLHLGFDRAAQGGALHPGPLGRTGAHVAGIAALGEGDVVYSPLPFFHSSSLFTGWASAISRRPSPRDTRPVLGVGDLCPTSAGTARPC